MQKLILIRGLPGSGKSTLAKKYVELGYDHFEADMYFLDKEGNYKFNPKYISAAHKWCKDSCQDFLIAGRNVVISNTFTQKWEMKPYIDLAVELNVEIEILEAKGNFQNVHGVPDEVIKKMKARWEEI